MINSSFIYSSFAFFVVGISCFGVLGCNGGGTEKEAMTQFSASTLNTAKTNQQRMRDLYKKTSGVYTALTPEEKAEFVKLNNGSEITATQSWGYLSTSGKASNFADEQKAANKK